MRIAVTGTHGSGKTTLIDAFCDARPAYAHEPEPYWALVQDGVPFADGPDVQSLEDQLRLNVATMLARSGDADVVFDRSPVDYLAYLDVVSAGTGLPWEPDGRLLSGIERALRTLDLLVFLPLSQPDEITDRIEFPRLRRAVDRRLKAILRDDDLGLFAEARPRREELRGTRAGRLARLVALTASG